MLTLPESALDGGTTCSTVLPTICACGKPSPTRAADLVAGKHECRSCATSRRIADGTAYKLCGPHPSHKPRSINWPRRIAMRTMHGAKKRCEDPTDAGYGNYGGRGIAFRFPSVADAADWVLENLGPRPKGGSLDRVDNEGHYEPGNLRWADRATQNGNKRDYRRGAAGERIRRLQESGCPYVYESIRGFIAAGMSDEQILNLKKGKHRAGSNL